MGEIVNRIEDNLKDTPNKRIGDVNILYLAGVVEDLKKKVDNGVMAKVDKIWQKLSILKCDVHTELIKKESEIRKLELQALSRRIDDAPLPNSRAIKWLFVLYGLLITTMVGYKILF